VDRSPNLQGAGVDAAYMSSIPVLAGLVNLASRRDGHIALAGMISSLTTRVAPPAATFWCLLVFRVNQTEQERLDVAESPVDLLHLLQHLCLYRLQVDPDGAHRPNLLVGAPKTA